MPQIFVSYSRVDRQFCAKLVGHLRRIYDYDKVWFDETLHGGEIWWNTILSHVTDCDIFIFLMTNEALNSPYCQAELKEARRLGKQILPVLIRAKTQIPPELSQIHYVDMQTGIKPSSLTELQAAIVRMERRIPAQPPAPLEPEPVAAPIIPTAERGKKPARLSRGVIVFGAVLAVALIGAALAVALIGAALLLSSRGGDGEGTPTPSVTLGEVAQVSATEAVEPSATNTATNTATFTSTASATFTLTLTSTSTNTPSVTNTSTPTLSLTPTLTPSFTHTLDIVAVVDTLDAQGTAAAATQNAVNATKTAAQWTATFTPNVTASIAAFITERAAQTGTIVAATQFAMTPLGLARHGVNTNGEWTPYVENFNGVAMALVPIGCFMMGGNDSEDEQPIHEQCFDEPFWIDVTEVTNAAYGSSGRFSSADRPRERVTWFDARDFCESRGARLPTEREWEYAARGPDGLTYPWGNAFVAENVVYRENSHQLTANVGSRPSGASWVGAVDMSGNVWEWVSSLYLPYDSQENREADTGNRTDVLRVLRGGSWYSDTGGLRSAVRVRDNPTGGINYIGFRCARS